MKSTPPELIQDRRPRLNERLRQAFTEGAEQPERLLRCYPGDV